MTADAANASAMMVVKICQARGVVKRYVSQEPAYVQNRQTKRFNPLNAVASRTASAEGLSPAP